MLKGGGHHIFSAILLNLSIDNLCSGKLQFGDIYGLIFVHLNEKYRRWRILFTESRIFNFFSSPFFFLFKSSALVLNSGFGFAVDWLP